MHSKRNQNKHRMLLAVFILLLLTGCSSKTSAVNTIRERGVIKIGVRKNSVYTEEPNGLSSVEQELIEQICGKLEIEPEYSFYSMNELEKCLDAGEIDAAVGMLSKEDWSGNKAAEVSETYDQKFLYVVTGRGDYSSSIKALSDRNAGVFDQISEGAKQQLYQADHVTLVMYSSAGEAAEDLKTNVISAFICYQEQAETLVSDVQLQVQDLRGISQEEYGVVTKAGQSDLMAVINEVIQESE